MKKKTFIILLGCIFAVALLFRFWNYNERYGLAYDQAHDVLVAREAIRQHKIPLLGPFSSAGPFQTSGTWYWIIMIGVCIFPPSILTPWIFMTFLCALLVVGMGLLGKYLENETFGYIAALFTAVSTAQIAQSVNLTNQTPIPLFSFLAIVFAILYMKKKNIIFAFLLGLFASLAASIHLQGVTLAFLVFWTFLLTGKQKIYGFFSAVVGAMLPILPIVIWDSQHSFLNVKNMWYYYTKDQFNISLDVLGRRWLTYLLDFWPREWSHIIGGFGWIAIVIVACFVLIFMTSFVQRKIKKEWLLIFLSFLCMSILVRYMRVPIFASFITFSHPFVILISSFVAYKIFRINRLIGTFVIILILSGSIWKSGIEAFTERHNWTAKYSYDLRKSLQQMYPNEQFAVYDYKYDETRRSVPFVLFLDEKNLVLNSGRRIGFIRLEPQELFQTAIISSSSGLVSDLTSSDSAQLIQDGWIQVNPSFIYTSTEEWR